MTTMQKILLVEDEETLAELLAEYLIAANYTVSIKHEGNGVVSGVQTNPPDLILLDLMLPGKNGIDICKEIRAFSTVPIIMVTAKVEEIDKLLGLELGADDYICKPYSPREVVARVKAVLRRSTMKAVSPHSSTILLIDEEKFTATFMDTLMDLTPVEFRLLKTLSDHPGRVFSRDQLIEKIYNDHRIVTDRTVDTHIKNLRRKMAEIYVDAEIITSIYGIGYKFDPP